MNKRELEKLIMKNREYYVRIRPDEEKNKDGKVYYSGFEPFEINDKGEIIIDFKKYLSINSYNIEKATINELKENIDAKRSLYYDIDEEKFPEIVIKKGKVCSSDKVMSDSQIECNKKFGELIEKLQNESNIEISENQKKKEYLIKLKKYDFNTEYKLFDYLYNQSKMSDVKYNIISKNGNNKEIDTRVIKVIANKPYFMNPKTIHISKDDDLNKIIADIKRITDDIESMCSFYEKNTHVEKEKKYQHMFLIYDGYNNDEFSKIFNNKVIPFECEYYIDEVKQDGRIDVIFYSVKTIDNNDTLTDLYLIELKVDTKVLGGSNGVHKHLLDIKNIKSMNNNFYNDLEKRIKYRYNFENNKELKIGKYQTHFYIIIGQCDTSTKGILQSLKTLNAIKEKKLKRKVELNDDYEKYNNTPVKDILGEIKKDIDIQLFIDTNPWVVDSNVFKPHFENFTNILEGKE